MLPPLNLKWCQCTQIKAACVTEPPREGGEGELLLGLEKLWSGRARVTSDLSPRPSTHSPDLLSHTRHQAERPLDPSKSYMFYLEQSIRMFGWIAELVTMKCLEISPPFLQLGVNIMPPCHHLGFVILSRLCCISLPYSRYSSPIILFGHFPNENSG